MGAVIDRWLKLFWLPWSFALAISLVGLSIETGWWQPYGSPPPLLEPDHAHLLRHVHQLMKQSPPECYYIEVGE